MNSSNSEVREVAGSFNAASSIQMPVHISNTDSVIRSPPESQQLVHEPIIQEYNKLENHEEIIRNLTKDIKSTPPSAEKFTMKIILELSKKLHQGIEPNGEIINTDLIELQRMINSQNILSNNVHQALSILINSLNHLDNVEHISNALSSAEEILKQIRPINLKEISRLISKTKTAAELIRDKDIILMMGPTGAGKSTTIQFLYGCKMKLSEVKIRNNILPHVTIMGDPPAPVTSSPENRSETLYIKPVAVTDKIGREIMLCDAPGTGDTAGIEADIANSIGIIDALKICKSVKLLVHISRLGYGDRGDGIRKLSHLLVNFVKGIEGRFKSIGYVFTKFDPHFHLRDNINSILDEATTNVNTKNDIIFLKVLEDMAHKAGKSWSILNPETDDRFEMLDYLRNKLKGIQYPGLVFQFPINESIKGDVRNQIGIYKTFIESALQKQDFKLIKYYLENFSLLKSILNQDFIKAAYEEVLGNLNNYVSTFLHEKNDKFHRILNCEESLKDKDLDEFQIGVKFANDCQILSQFLGQRLPSPGLLNQNLKNELRKMKEELKDEPISSSAIKSYLNNMKLISNSLVEFQGQYSEDIAFYSGAIKNLYNKVEESITNDDLNNFSCFALELHHCLPVFKDHLKEDVEEKFENSIKLLLNYLDNLNLQAQRILDRLEIKEDDMIKIKDLLEKFREIKENHILNQLLRFYFETQESLSVEKSTTPNYSSQYYNQFIEKIIDYYKRIHSNIIDIFERESKSFDEIQKLFKKLENLVKIPEVYAQISTDYFTILDKIHYLIQSSHNDAQAFIDNIDINSNSVNFKLIKSKLTDLKKKSEWLKDKDSEANENFLPQLFTDIEQISSKLNAKMMKIDFNLKFPSSLANGYALIKKAKAMEPIDSMIPKVKENRILLSQQFYNEIQSHCYDQIQRILKLEDEKVYELEKEINKLKQELILRGSNQEILDKIEEKEKKVYELRENAHVQDFNGRLEAEFVSNCMNYLKECEKIKMKEIREKAQYTLDLIEKYLRSYRDFIRQDIENNFFDIWKANIGENLISLSNRLDMRLQELILLEKYENLYQIIDEHGLIRTLQILFESHYGKMIIELNQLSQSGSDDQLTHRININDALICLDRFCSNCRFTELSHDQRLKLMVDFRQSCDKSEILPS